MRPVERKVRRLLKRGYGPNRARQALVVDSKIAGGSRVSHWIDAFWNVFCGCHKMRYKNLTHWHFTEVDCKKARVAFCVDNETGEISKHPMLACPHGEYKERIDHDL